jgi:hypothetical protein
MEITVLLKEMELYDVISNYDELDDVYYTEYNYIH